MSDIFEDIGLLAQDKPSLAKPWMNSHAFYLVKTVSALKQLVDDCLEHGNCSLDLETEGLDNRIFTKSDGSIYTKHAIVGYCIGLKGAGYYIPVRHNWNKVYTDNNPNVDSVYASEQEIKRLCLASQPELTDEGLALDDLGAPSKYFKVPPKVVIKFWNAKFDQEFLFPLTNLVYWHPDSFEDGMLANYVIQTSDVHGLKDNAATKLSVTDDQGTHPYTMIKFNDLFPAKMDAKLRRFNNLEPSESGSGWNCVLYGCSDAICTDLLCDKLVPVASGPKYRGFYRLEKQVVQAVRLMERYRVKIDRSTVSDLLDEATSEVDQITKRLQKFAESLGFPNFNPGSNGTVGELLFSAKGLHLMPPPPKTATGDWEVSAKVLENYSEDPKAHEVIQDLINYKWIQKQIGTYLVKLKDNCDTDDQIRLNLKQTGADTGRFTAPNGAAEDGFGAVPIQGIPAKNDPRKPKVAHSLRKMFVPRPGYIFVKADYASQELRITASVSDEPLWINEYIKEIEEGIPADLHYLTAKAFFPDLTPNSADYKLKRGQGKTANFALVYGGGPKAVQRATGCDESEAALKLKAFQDSVPVFTAWGNNQKRKAISELGVRTAFGRWLALPDAAITESEIMVQDSNAKKAQIKKLQENNRKIPPECHVTLTHSQAAREARKIRSSCARRSTNYPIQGSGADILKISMVLLFKESHLRGWLADDSVRMVMTVHDEIVYEILKSRVAEAVPVLRKIMEYPSTLAKWKIPLIAEAELGDSWAAKTDWITMLHTGENIPDYLKGATVDLDPDSEFLCRSGKLPRTAGKNVIVLDENFQGLKKNKAIKDPAEPTTPKEPEVREVVTAPPAAEPTPEHPEANTDYGQVALNGNAQQYTMDDLESDRGPTSYSTGQVAVFRLSTSTPTTNTVACFYNAWSTAKSETFKLGRNNERIPIELIDSNGKVLIPRTFKITAYPPELARKMREGNLGPQEYVLDVY
jgi:DNA polymerase I-like protein with 3'-5' exonuclease and polymerase domains